MSNRGYSVDLRTRVVSACDAGSSAEDAAKAFKVGPATVYRWLELRHETGALAPRPHGGGHPPALDESGRQKLSDIVRDKPDSTLQELKTAITKRVSRMVKGAGETFSLSTSAVHRTLEALGITRKKKACPQSKRTVRMSRSGIRSSSKK